MILSWELPHTNYTPLKLFPKAKGLPKSVSFFDSPFDRQKPILLIINFTVRTATHAVLAVRCDKDAGRDCGSDNA